MNAIILKHYAKHPLDLLRATKTKIKSIPPVHKAGVTVKGMLHAKQTETRVDGLEEEKTALENEVAALKKRVRDLEFARDFRKPDRAKEWIAREATEAAEKREGEPERIKAYREVIDKIRRDGETLRAADLGCGRGGWLAELAGTDGVRAVGVDSDNAAARVCGERGLTVIASDAVKWLKNCQSGSQDLVTMLHLAEHLTPDQLCEAVEECGRVIRAGGALIVEAPDPEKAEGYSVFLDPAFVTVVHPEALKRIAERAGFTEIRIIRFPGGDYAMAAFSKEERRGDRT